MIIMSSSILCNFVCVLLFLLLVVKVDSQIRFPSDNNRRRVSSNCNCMVIWRCPVLRNRPDWTTAGRTCGYGRGPQRRVCCPSFRPPPETTRPPIITEPPVAAPVTRPPVEPENPDQGGSVCGVSNYVQDPFKPLIVGGQNATEGQWPWMAAIRKRESTGYYSASCSGFLIDRKHVLSAAHCFQATGDDLYRARIGKVNQKIADEYHITRIKVHEGYKKGHFYDDIAVLTLDREVHFRNFNPVCLPNKEVSRMDVPGRGTTVAGWGADKYGGNMKAYLQYLAQLPIISNQECLRKLRQGRHNTFRQQFPNNVSIGLICAAFKVAGKDACDGDSGGPMMIQYRNWWYAIGVVSFGFNCGIPGMPGGYTRVANYVDWIKQNTKD